MLDHLVTQRFMRCQRNVIVRDGIGRHFNATLGPGPLFRGPNKRFSNAVVSPAVSNKPALNISNRMPRIA